MDNNELIKRLKHLETWPEAFAEGAQVWDDDYISRNMLAAHLDNSHNKASYNNELRQRVVNTIVKRCALKEGDCVLDLGCGPGLYAAEFAKRGISYTGIDISRQSLGYAMSHKGQYAKLISYIKGDYTKLELEKEYDCVVMIWCDFGAMSPQARDEMLRNVKGALKPGGHFCFDVYALSSPFEEKSNSWRIEQGGFWRRDTYALLERSKYYDTVNAALYEAAIISEEDVNVYRIWDKRYKKDELLKVLRDAGFKAVSAKKGGLSRAQKNMYGVFAKS